MKLSQLLAIILSSVTLANADVVVEQKIESQLMNGNIVMKTKGDKMRMDMPSPLGGNITTIMDVKSGEQITLIHAQKMAMKSNINTTKAQAEAAQKAAGIDLSKVEKPTATGQKEKIGEWDTEIYTAKIGNNAIRMWVASNVKDGQAIKDEMNKLSAATGPMGGLDPKALDVPGLAIKTEMEMLGQKIVTTIVKAELKAVDDAEFVAPTDYNTVGQ